MLKKGYLAANSVYACTEHKQEIVGGYFAELDPIFDTIKQCEDGLDVSTLLEGPLCHSGFKRLN
jgi:glutamate-1-semialdehyde 2,1-aminomutase